MSNCTIEKRHYRKGYHIVRNQKPSGVSKEHVSIERKAKIIPQSPTVILVEKSSEHPIVEASAAITDEAIIKTSIRKPYNFLNDTCGDVILFRNGDELKVKIIEVNETIIKYRRCDNLDGPLISTSADNVFMIKYVNGITEVFKKPVVVSDPVYVKQQALKKVNNPFAIASFICAMLSFLVIPGPLALLFGLIAFKQISNEPGKYKGHWMAIVGTIIGGIMSTIILLVLFSA